MLCHGRSHRASEHFVVQLKKSGLVGILARTLTRGNVRRKKNFTRISFCCRSSAFVNWMIFCFATAVVQSNLIVLALHACGAISRCGTSSIAARNLNATVLKLAAHARTSEPHSNLPQSSCNEFPGRNYITVSCLLQICLSGESQIRESPFCSGKVARIRQILYT